MVDSQIAEILIRAIIMIIFVVFYESNKSLFCNLQDTKGMTCLHVAVRQGHADLIKLLLKTGRFDINEKVQDSPRHGFC